jgi:hypothetical protein
MAMADPIMVCGRVKRHRITGNDGGGFTTTSVLSSFVLLLPVVVVVVVLLAAKSAAAKAAAAEAAAAEEAKCGEDFFRSSFFLACNKVFVVDDVDDVVVNDDALYREGGGVVTRKVRLEEKEKLVLAVLPLMGSNLGALVVVDCQDGTNPDARSGIITSTTNVVITNTSNNNSRRSRILLIRLLFDNDFLPAACGGPLPTAWRLVFWRIIIVVVYGAKELCICDEERKKIRKKSEAMEIREAMLNSSEFTFSTVGSYLLLCSW